MKAHILEATQHTFLEEEGVLVLTKMIMLIIYDANRDIMIKFDPIIESYNFLVNPDDYI